MSFARLLAHQGVGDGGQQQHNADKEQKPVVVPPRIDDAKFRHTVDQRADGGADGSPVPAGEHATTDDGSHDVEQLIARTFSGLHDVIREQLYHAGKPGGDANCKVETHFDSCHRNADGSGRLSAAAYGINPVACASAQQQPGADCDTDQPPKHDDVQMDTTKGKFGC